MTARLGPIRWGVRRDPGGGFSSRWSRSERGLEVTLAAAGASPHDTAIELLLCLGEALWEKAPAAEREAWLRLLAGEIDAGVEGELDEDARREKHALLAGRVSARSRRRLERYARASFAATAAEYVHCLWHDVTVEAGPEHLPALWLRRRLELLARWFPPNRGYRLFSAAAPDAARAPSDPKVLRRRARSRRRQPRRPRR